MFFQDVRDLRKGRIESDDKGYSGVTACSIGFVCQKCVSVAGSGLGDVVLDGVGVVASLTEVFSEFCGGIVIGSVVGANTAISQYLTPSD